MWFVWLYCWHLTLVPIGILLTKPFNNWTWHKYAEHFIKNVCGIRHTMTADEPLIEAGYVLANHRSWFDFAIDPYLASSCIMGRNMGFIAVFFFSLLGYIDDIIVCFSRGSETRFELFSRIKQHIKNHKTRNRILIWPEGTRLKYTCLASSEDVKSYLKYGMLKCIYEDKEFPVQLQISNNKEFVIDEKRMLVQCGVRCSTHRSKSIHPNDFATEQAFYDEIARVWYECYVKTHIVLVLTYKINDTC